MYINVPCCQSLRLSQLHACSAQSFQGKTGSILCFSIVTNNCHCKKSICAVEDSTPRLPFRVAGTKGERLPTLYPEHLARRRRRVPGAALGTVSPTALPHCSSHVLLAKVSGRGASTSVLAQGHTSGAGRHPPDPCSRGPASAKWFPVRLAEGSHGGSGRGAGTPLPKGSCRCIQSLSVSRTALFSAVSAARSRALAYSSYPEKLIYSSYLERSFE